MKICALIVLSMYGGADYRRGKSIREKLSMHVRSNKGGKVRKDGCKKKLSEHIKVSVLNSLLYSSSTQVCPRRYQEKTHSYALISQY